MNRKSNREGHTQKRSSYALRLRNTENCAITGEQVVAHPTNDTPIGNFFKGNFMVCLSGHESTMCFVD
jgi:ribosomal protein L32